MIDEVMFNFADRIYELLFSPFHYPDMLWIITPLFLAMILQELYFARYKFEELGWNSAYANGLVLIFVAIDLFRILYNSNELTFISQRNVLVITLTVVGIVLAVLNYLHLWNKEFAFGISSKLPTNFVVYMAVVLIYSRIPIDLYTLFASVIVLLIFILIILGIQFIVPKAIELDEDEYKESRNAPHP